MRHVGCMLKGVMRTVSSNYLKMVLKGCCGLLRHDEEKIAALNALLTDGGRNLDNPTHRYERRLVGKLINETARFTGDSATGVRVGMTLRPEGFMDIGHAITLCDNLRDVIALNQSYQRLNQELGKTHLDVIGNSAWMKWTPLYAETEFYAQMVEMIFAGYASIGRWLLWGEDNPVLSMHFRHAPPADLTTQKTVFCDKVFYNAEFDGVEFVAEAVEVPMPNRNPEMLEFIKARLDQQLLQLDTPVTVTEEALLCIQSSLSEGRPSITQIAKLMGMSERTLRRRLDAEGKSFRTVLELARRESCEAYMRDAGVSHADVALRLGFNDQSAFSRAFKVWFNQTPSQYRQALADRAAE